jgi:hypothetical protein
MLEGFIPSGKRLLLVALIGCAFFVGAQTVLAGSVFPPDGPPDGFTPPAQPGPGGAEGFEDRVGGGVIGGGGTSGGGGGSGVNGTDPDAIDSTQPATEAGSVPTTQVNYACYDGIGMFLHCITVSVFGGLAAVAGYALDRSIEWFIVDFGEMYNQNGLGAVADSVWETVRDVFNLTFIFGLVYIGFQIILGVNESGAKRTIPMLILAALLVNFSLFIVKFIVDFANLAAVQVYNLFAATSNTSENPAASVVGFLTDGDVSIALAFLNLMGVTSLLGYQPNGDSPLIFFFGTILVFLVLTYVFLAGAVMISVRFVALIFYIIFSPVMFLGWVFPGLSSYTRQFWSGLIGQAFFAPAFLFMLYISFRLIQGYNFAGREGTEVHSLGEAGQSVTASLAAILPFFILTVIFLLASVMVARKMASSGSSMVMKANDWGIGKAKAFAAGAAGGYGAGAYLGYKGLDKAANSDSRLYGARALAQGVTKYTTARDKLEKSYKASYIGSTKEDQKKRLSEMAGRIESAQERKSGENKVALAAEGMTELTALRGRDYATLSAADKDKLITLESNQAAADKYITGLDKSDIEKLSPAKRKEYANRFSSEQVSKIMDSDKISATEKAELFGARVSSITSKIGGTTPTPDKATKLTRDELDTLGFEWVTRNAHMLTASQFDDYLKNSKKMTPEVAETLKNRRKNELLSQISAGTADSILKELKKRPKEFAQLPKEALMEDKYLNKIYGHITTSVLEQIASEKTIGPAERANLKAFLLNPTRTTGHSGVTRDVKDYLKSDEGKKYYGA